MIMQRLYHREIERKLLINQIKLLFIAWIFFSFLKGWFKHRSRISEAVCEGEVEIRQEN